jgi:DNA processing protein
MSRNTLPYYLGFSYCFGIGPMTFKALKSHFKIIKKAYQSNKKELEAVLGIRLTEKFLEFRRRFDPVKELERLKKNHITVLAIDDENYPQSLKDISDRPICIYLKGSTSVFSRKKNMSSPFFAIVGTRKPTTYGIQVARKFAYELTASGFVIVSGMAYGIDTIAHQSCLEAGGKTIAVLGCGVDIVYPPSNKLLYEKIIRSGGTIISEFPPGQFVLKGFFVARNRIISALSSGVMVIEGTINSGSLITARYAAEQGKEVFAPPNPITSNMSAAPNLLLKEGAKLVTSIDDILEEFNMKITPRKKEDIKKNLSEIGKLIFDILQKNPQTVDDLAIELSKTVPEVLNAISVMEIEGVIEKNQENKYQIRI